MSERRYYKRFKVREGALVVHSGHIGQILDISRGGLLCQCIGNKNLSEEPKACDIFCVHDAGKFKLKEVPINRVRNNINQLSPWNTTLVRRCGIKFGDLTSSQQTQLENFINHLSTE